MRANSPMKFALAMIAAGCLIHSAHAFSLINNPGGPPPTRDWTVAGPGGRYGLLSYPYGTYAVFASRRFYVTRGIKIAAGSLFRLGLIVSLTWLRTSRKPREHDNHAA